MATTIKQDLCESNNKSELHNGKEEFGNLDISAFGDGLKTCNIVSLDDGLLTDPDTCGLCGERLTLPRVLSCLHVFCEHCLDKEMMNEGGDPGLPETTVNCPTCQQDTKVGNKKLASLPMDVTTINVLDVSNTSNLQCTSCTFKEVALSRCCTCHNLLCYNCDKAHRFMRCFEHHTVITLEDLRKDGKKITVHKPLTCDAHANEHVLFYCSSCDVPVCGECTKTEHKQHLCESILDSEVRVRQEMEGMLKESKTKLEQLGKVSNEVHTCLEELGHQRSAAKDLINESYQSYKALLEQCRDDALKELRELYQERELKLMELTEKVGRNSTLLEDACKFTNRLLENGTIAEIMYLRKTVGKQLAKLNAKMPAPDKNGYSVEFRTDFDEFKRVLKSIFGKFHTESCNSNGIDTKEAAMSMTSSTNSAISLPPLITNGSLSNGSTAVRSPAPNCASPTVNLTPSPATSGTSAPTFDSDLVASLQGLSLTQAAAVVAAAAASSSPANGGTPAPSPITPTAAALQGFSSIAEYNIAQLATIAENNASAAAVVANVANSPPPSFTTLADLFTTDTAYKNLASLAKLGLANSADNNIPNGNILMRSNSPAALNIPNTLINGFSTSTSPLMTTADDMMSDPLNAIVSQQSGASGSTPAGTASGGSSVGPLVTRNSKVSPMQIRCKFGQLGPSKGQFNSPHGFCLGLEEDIIVADTNNHRIQVFEKTGNFKFQFGIPGKDEGQLWYPRKVAVMRSSGKYVVCDRGNERSRMQIFTKNGHFVKKIAIRYIDIVAGLAVTAHGEIVAVDSVSPTVFVISENGDLLRWFDCSDYMREPSDIAIHGKEYYVCDFKGHNVVVFSEDGAFIRRIGCENLTNFPNGIDISDAGDVLIGDSHGNRFHVAVFSRDGSLISEFECPYVKVSRCCGLKITSEGFVVTLAKNNHHVLVLNTLYIL